VIRMRHLHPSFAEGALRRGVTITQLLPDSADVGKRRTITWLRASRRTEGHYVLGRHYVFDEGSPDFIDVWEFSSVDDDEDLGQGVDLAAFDSPAALLAAATSDWRADPERWVNEGVIQDEYRDLRHD
jgi:hypothetical protein